jgi:phosphoribosylamine---glycine ligase
MVDGVAVFHAGTAPAGQGIGPGDHGAVVTSGGRVLGVTALGDAIDTARVRAYRGVSAISWPGMQRRSDIALAASEPSGPATATPERQEVSR